MVQNDETFTYISCTRHTQQYCDIYEVSLDKRQQLSRNNENIRVPP
jgi:hypothetical protein